MTKFSFLGKIRHRRIFSLSRYNGRGPALVGCDDIERHMVMLHVVSYHWVGISYSKQKIVYFGSHQVEFPILKAKGRKKNVCLC